MGVVGCPDGQGHLSLEGECDEMGWIGWDRIGKDKMSQELVGHVGKQVWYLQV